MSDLAFGLVAGLSLLCCNALVLARVRTWLNPVSIISAGYFLPLLFAVARLSDLQAHSWTSDTFIVLWQTVLFWLVLPTAALLVLPQLRHEFNRKRLIGEIRPWFRWYARGLAIAYVLGTLLQNFLIGGHAFLLLDPELAIEHHTSTLPILQIIGHAGFIAAALLHLSYYQRKSAVDLLLLPLVVLTPISKLGRIDVMMSIATLAILNAQFPVIRLNFRRGLIAILAAGVAAWGLVELGNQRMNQYGRYSVSYADAIGFNTWAGPGELWAVGYGYFSLSFENFDRFVRNNPSYRTNGALSFSPAFNSLFFITRLTGGQYPDESQIVARRNPVGPMATVGTALSAFYLDFGAAFAWVPMLVYGILWIVLFAFRRYSSISQVFFAGYSAAMALAGFQHVMAAPFIYQALLLAVVPFRWRFTQSSHDAEAWNVTPPLVSS